MTYNEAMKFIHGVSGVFCKPGLERISELCSALDNPQSDLKFIHVAGTNGKGSTSTMLSSVLSEAGYKVGMYTSPYIYRFNERIQVMGKEISDEALISLCEQIKPIAENMKDKPTEFELITAMAFEHFKCEACDVIVLEVGLGGRFDSTNIIRNPALSIITGISLDHTNLLGDTVEKIAAEKAGIIKDSAPVIYGGDSDSAFEVISDVARRLGSEVFRTDRGEICDTHLDLSGGCFSYKGWKNVSISLLGEYQFFNAALVLDSIELLRDRGFKIPRDAVYRGISAAHWKARFEIISKNPLFIFDGAHNPEGVSAAVSSIKRYYPGGRVAIISGVLGDKDYRAVAASIASVADRVFTITPGNQRALSAKEYAEVLEELGATAIPMPSIEDAVSAAVKYAKQMGKPLFCLGSLYTYSDVVNALSSLGY